MFSIKHALWNSKRLHNFKFDVRICRIYNLKKLFVYKQITCNLHKGYRIFPEIKIFEAVNCLVMAEGKKLKSDCTLLTVIDVVDDNSTEQNILAEKEPTAESKNKTIVELDENCPGRSTNDVGSSNENQNLQERFHPNSLQNASFNNIPFLMVNGFSNNPLYQHNMYLPFAAYSTFSESVVQNPYFNQTHLPSYNCLKFELCRTFPTPETVRETKGILPQNISVKPLRSWETTRSGFNLKKQSKKPRFPFKLMCYNVLAQSLLEEHPELYRYHSPNDLRWEERWKNLRQEIVDQDPDILCLQEVQETHLKGYYDTLESLGYKCLYKRRTGFKVDGCAIYYKSYIVNLVEYTTVEYNQSYNPVLDRDNVAIIARFVPKLYPKAEFVVATTHLLYNPRREDVRLAQTQLLLSELDRMAYKKIDSDKSYPYVPVILTGDFNTQPYYPVYKLITYGYLNYAKLSNRSLEKSRPGDAVTGNRFIPPQLGVTDTCQHIELLQKRKENEIGRQEEEKLIRLKHSEREFSPVKKSPPQQHKNLFSTGTLSHGLALRSVFKHRVGDKCEATTYQNRWLTVDYIFYSGVVKSGNFAEDKLKLVSRYTIPTEDQLQGVKIPNSDIGSDHLSLVAKFTLEE